MFMLDDDQLALQSAVRDFTRRYCPRQQVREWDERREFPRHVYKALADHGYMGVAIDPEYGGTGGDVLSQVIIMEELCRAMQGSATMWLNTSCIGAKNVSLHGNEDQKRELLPRIAAGELFFCFSITEPDGGTDLLGHLNTHSRPVEGGWLVNGRKVYSSAADIADYLLLATRSKPVAELSKKSDGVTVFLFPKDTPGIAMRAMPTIGQRTIMHWELGYTDVFVPDKYVFGEPHNGWKTLIETINNERILVAAYALGHAQAALEDSIAYANEREAFGKPIGAFQAIAHYVANMAMSVEAARMMTYKAAWLQSRGLPCAKEAAMAKVMASDAASAAADTGIQIMGGYGLLVEMDMQRYWRDSRPMRIGPVTNEVARNFIARQLGLPKSS
jgi:acyl-CoA dehydrogenase